MKCTKCNNNIQRGASFCSNCGSAVKYNKLKLFALKCPNCDGLLEVEDGLDTFFCQYCGHKIMLEGQSAAAYRAKTKIKGMEHDERMADKKYAHEKYKIEYSAKQERSKSRRGTVLTILGIMALVILFGGYFGGAAIKSNQMEKELQTLVNEIMVDIENEDFDEAYIKAQSIKHTSPWSDEVEEKWDETRSEVINQIIEAEKKTTGKSSHKPEKNGLFNGLFNK